MSDSVVVARSAERRYLAPIGKRITSMATLRITVSRTAHACAPFRLAAATYGCTTETTRATR